jgi:hypothetical protein
MTTTVWVLIVLLLSPNGDPTSFELERRFETYEDCMDARVGIMNAWSRAEYIDSWCRGVEIEGIVV